jgi:hypothetical protein
MTGTRPKRRFGQITLLPSKRYRARYTGPDTERHNAPHTFEAREDAEAWLAAERRLVTSDDWTAPSLRARVTQLRRVVAIETNGLSNRRGVWLPSLTHTAPT